MRALRAVNGHPQPHDINYWEIGNELYGDWKIGHTTATEYADRYLAFRKAMLAVDPSVRIIANGHDAAWNEQVVAHAKDTVQTCPSIRSKDIKFRPKPIRKPCLWNTWDSRPITGIIFEI